jgi:Na+-transporting NADH:ubiquinone oxidoreductase subunit NqrD
MRKSLFTTISAIALVAAPRAALACPVCFGNSDAPMAVATNTGVFFMLGVVAVMLTAFASFFVYLIRRAKRAADQTASGETPRLAPSEGTAQC